MSIQVAKAEVLVYRIEVERTYTKRYTRSLRDKIGKDK